MGHQAALVRPLTETETLPTEYSDSVSTRLFFPTLELYDGCAALLYLLHALAKPAVSTSDWLAQTATQRLDGTLPFRRYHFNDAVSRFKIARLRQ